MELLKWLAEHLSPPIRSPVTEEEARKAAYRVAEHVHREVYTHVITSDSAALHVIQEWVKLRDAYLGGEIQHRNLENTLSTILNGREFGIAGTSGYLRADPRTGTLVQEANLYKLNYTEVDLSPIKEYLDLLEKYRRGE